MAVIVCMIEGLEAPLHRTTVDRSLQSDVSIFERRAKWVETMSEWRRTLLCFAGRGRASVTIVLCYDIGVGRGVVSSYVRSKFAK